MPKTFVYFAYGSNMLSRRLCSSERTPSAKAIETGFIIKRRLTFHKLSCDGSGKCDIESTENASDRVYGVLFEIDDSEKGKLDKAEGRGKGYDEGQVDVVTSTNTIKAYSYIAIKKESELRPYHWYKALVIAGAVEHGLPKAYVEWLQTFQSHADPDIKRRAKNEKILFGS